MTDAEKTAIYTDFHEKVLNYVNSKVCNMTQAEDITSDIFLKIYEKLDTFDESKSSLSTWIFTITRNTLTDYYRTRKVFSEVPEDFRDDTCIDDEICNDEMLDTLADALESLDERERDLIILRYYKGLTLTEIAQRMDISYSYVKILHNKALSGMRGYF